MSTFWSGWVIALATFNLVVTFFLFIWGQRVEIPTLEDGTTGHSWANGSIRESVRRLPVWWVIVSAALFAAAVIYLIRYPGYGANKGTLGWSAHQELAQTSKANLARLDQLYARYRPLTVEQLATDPEATGIGHRLFVDNCAACHGREAHGNPLLGAPNLTDGDWLYGGDGQTIVASVLDGRHGVMPGWSAAFGEDGVTNLANYVLSLSGAPHDAAKAAAGQASFAACMACHGPDAHGNPALGAPNLTDTVWLYGGDIASVEKTIRDGRNGQMPPWRERLGEDNVRLIAAWIYGKANPGGTATH